MIQFNLLPDIKIEYIKTRYRKRLLMFVSAVLSVVFLAIFLILFVVVHVNQKLHLKHLNEDIAKYSKEINSVQDVNGLLTIQNQLSALPALHSDKVVSSRIIDYLSKVTPAGITLSNVSVDYTASTMTLKGNANDLVSVNKYTDSLKYTDFKLNGKASGKDSEGRAFGGVVLSSFSLPVAGGTQADSRSSFNINVTFNPAIFAQIEQDDQQKGMEPVVLTVPTITSSVSESQKPTLFKEQVPVTPTGGQQ